MFPISFSTIAIVIFHLFSDNYFFPQFSKIFFSSPSWAKISIFFLSVLKFRKKILHYQKRYKTISSNSRKKIILLSIQYSFISHIAITILFSSSICIFFFSNLVMSINSSCHTKLSELQISFSFLFIITPTSNFCMSR